MTGSASACAVERDAHLAEAAVDGELGDRGLGAVDGELRVQLGGRHGRCSALQRLRGFWRNARQERHYRRHVGRVEVDPHAALRRRRGDDAAARRKRRAAEIGDRQAVDLHAVAVDLYSCARIARDEAADGGAADIGGDRHVVRPLDRGAGEQRLAEAERGVDIEFGRVKHGVELGHALAGGEHISEAAGDGLAVERRLQALDRDFVAAERDVAAQRQRPHIALRRLGAPFQPGRQRLGIAGFDLGRPGEVDPVAGDRQMAAQLHLREAGRAKLEAVEIPSLGVGADVAAHIGDAVAAETDLVDADADLDRHGRAEGAACQFGYFADGRGRRRPDAVAAGEHAVEIDLAARQHAVEARVLAEFEIGDAGELERLLVRAVLEFELLHQGRHRADLDLAAHMPGLGDLRGAARGDADRPRQTQIAVEFRLRPGERQHAVGFDAERMIDRIDIDMELERAVVGIAAAGYAERIKLAADGDGALAFERAEQRTRLAVEPKAFERGARAVRRIAQRHLAVLDAEMVDRQVVGAEIDRQVRRLHTAGGVEAEAELRADQMHLGRVPFAAHQGPERKFEAERTGADLVPAGLADFDAVQRQRRRRQQPRVDGAGDAHVDADQAARLRLEQRAMAAPIDQQRTDQRRYQRQYDRDRQSKKGRLQRQLPRRAALKPGVQALYDELLRQFSPSLAANLCRRCRRDPRAAPLRRARRSFPDS